MDFGSASLNAQRPVPGEGIQGLLDLEREAVPAELRRTSSADLGTAPIDPVRYTSSEFANAEVDRMWSKVWQMACREEDIAEVGQYEVYEIGNTSLIVTRTAPDEIRAYYNACLHRGRQLCEASGQAKLFRCPFHGFAWNLDGSCRNITNGWDFPQVDKAEYRLPEAKVGRWGGFVFVNLDPDAGALDDYLEDLPQVYETRGWDLAARRKTVHVAKTNSCNWKVALEAFIESFHVVATHPSAMPYIGDAYTQYDVWPDRRHYTRMIAPRGLHSPHIAPLSENQVYRAGIAGADPEGAKTAALPPGVSARQAMGDRRREALTSSGIEADDITDCEALDTIQYHIFPNLVCWAGWGSFLVYRFRPNGDDVNSSIMDIMFVSPVAGGEAPAKPIVPTRIGVDESHDVAPQLGGYCAVFDEDSGNLAALQKGLKTMRTGVTLGRYQENRIRHFHQVLDSYLGR